MRIYQLYNFSAVCARGWTDQI